MTTRRSLLKSLLALPSAFAVKNSVASIISGDEYEAYGFSRHLALARTEPFRCVGAFRQGCIGSGVWIGGRHVLTTAHSVVNQDTVAYRDPAIYEFVLVDDKLKPRIFQVKKFWVPRAYFKSVKNPEYWGRLGADIAVVQLDRIPRLTGVSPTETSDHILKIGTVATLVGHGLRGNTVDGTLDKFGAGYKDNLPQALGFRASVLQLQAEKHKHVLVYDSTKKIDLQGIVSSSDSGGGAFIEENGATKLVGVISTSQRPTLEGKLSEKVVQMGFTSVGPYKNSLVEGLGSNNWQAFENYDKQISI